MKIIDVIALVEDSLYAVRYEGEEFDEFTKCFDLWNNPVLLREFFEHHEEDLKNDFWKGITIEKAILKTRKDAQLLEEELLYIAETGKTDRLESLSTLFEPLSERFLGEDFERDKAKGLKKRSWLRIYAIRVDLNFFVTCGGAIKLTPTMNEREHLIVELQKLAFTRNYLLEDADENLDFTELS